MKLVVEISLYPLMEGYVEPIKDFIERLKHYNNIRVSTGPTSTLVAGDYQQVISIVGKEMQVTHQQVGQAIFVCKFLNGDKMEHADL